MIKVGITGGIGSGKTTVCKMFEKHFNTPIYYADRRAKYLINHDKTLKNSIKQHFGNVYHHNGRINRKILASIVFNNKEKLKQLNLLVHPRVRIDGNDWFDRLKGKFPYALKEAALLYESKSHLDLDKIIVVHAPDEERILRVMKRDKVSKEQVLARMKNQLSQKTKMSKADFLIENIDKSQLFPQLQNIHDQLMNSIG